MSRIAYVNGRYLPHAQAAVHIEDRGFQFADAVYEVCEVRGAHIIDEARHLARLQRSLGELRIRAPMNETSMKIVVGEVLRRNRVRNGLVYLQVTRGAARRDFLFPPEHVRPTFVVTARHQDLGQSDRLAEQGVTVITVPETRWDRVDIKTTGLLPNVLAKMKAKEAGAREAWFIDRDGFVTEGGSSNAWIISRDGTLITRPAEHGILRGITRTTLIDLAGREGLKIEERPFTVAEALAAQEAFLTSATTVVMPIVRIDESAVGSGTPGPLAKKLRQGFHTIAEARAI